MFLLQPCNVTGLTQRGFIIYVLVLKKEKKEHAEGKDKVDDSICALKEDSTDIRDIIFNAWSLI